MTLRPSKRRPMRLSGIDAGDVAFAAVVEAFRADPHLAAIVAAYKAAQGHGRKFGRR